MQKDNLILIDITDLHSNLRIDKIPSLLSFCKSRTQVAQWIELGLITVNKKKIKPSYVTQSGDQISVVLPHAQNLDPLMPFPMDLEIVYEDPDIIIINKPAGLVVHPSLGHINNTLVNALIYNNISLSKGSAPERPGIVHRLDKETSGLLVIAKTDFAYDELISQFKKREIHRIYKALVYGIPKDNSFTIKTFFGRHSKNRKKFSSKLHEGKIAITHVQKLQDLGTEFCLLKLKLETGRTHQIRVHLSDMGFPIIGDKTYGSDRRIKNISSKSLQILIKSLSRIALFAEGIEFVHPRSKKIISFSIGTPKDLEELFKKIGIINASKKLLQR